MTMNTMRYSILMLLTAVGIAVAESLPPCYLRIDFMRSTNGMTFQINDKPVTSNDFVTILTKLASLDTNQTIMLRVLCNGEGGTFDDMSAAFDLLHSHGFHDIILNGIWRLDIKERRRPRLPEFTALQELPILSVPEFSGQQGSEGTKPRGRVFDPHR
jgi:hypothetical protein